MKYNGLKLKSSNKQAATIMGILILLLLITFPLAPLSIASAEEIKSRAAVVMDAETGRVLYAKNPDLRLMPASTTKLMTALVVIERTNLGDVVTVSKKASLAPATKIGLRQGDNITIEALLNTTLIKSANDAAVALAEATAGSEEEFVSLMNEKALALGLNNTRFINPNGLPGTGQYITAHDLAEIMRQAIRYPLLKEILGTRMAEIYTGEGKTILIRNTNKLLWSDEALLEGKTGYTREARHCFVGAKACETGTIIVALLGTPSRTLLWKETEDLMALGTRVMNNLEEPVVYISKVDYGTAKVKKASYKVKKASYKKSKKKKKRHRI
ncbi:MAG: D-alanyl-D-alanine carboxypeptidase family protein [Thermodesulfovibrionales bacterium]